MKAIVLVAGRGRRLSECTSDPKCLLEIGGTPLIHRYLDALGPFRSQISEVVLVVGYRPDAIRRSVGRHPAGACVRYVTNPRFEEGSVLSLHAGLAGIDDDILLMDGDVYFEPTLVHRLLEAPAENLLLVDTRSVNTGEEIMAGARGGRLVEIGRGMRGDFDVYGEWVGFLRAGRSAARRLASLIGAEIARDGVKQGYEDVLQQLADAVPFEICLVDDLRWTEIDFVQDVERARALAAAA